MQVLNVDWQRTRWLAAGLAVTLLWSAGDAGPVQSSADAVVTTLMRRELPDLAGKEALMLTVEYPPGGASLPHRHDADVFVYVLAGEVVMQVAGQAAVTLKAGRNFLRSPDRRACQVGEREPRRAGETAGAHGEGQGQAGIAAGGRARVAEPR